MRRGLSLAATFVAGAVVGAAVVLARPVPGVPDGRVSPSPARDAVVGEAPVSTLLAWTPGRLPDGYAEAVAALPSVRAVTVVRSGIVWIERWADAGGPTNRPRSGFRVPVEVAAVDPSSYRLFVPPADRRAVDDLARGAVVLGRTGAALRDIGPGGTLDVAGRTLRIGAVLEDELVGAHEVVVSARTGSALGVDRPRYLLVAPRAGVPADRVEAGLRRLVPAGVRVRIRAPGETPVFRHGDAVLPQAEVKKAFGEFAAVPRADGTVAVEPSWVRANVRTARVPLLGAIRCHRLLIPLVRGALEDLERRGLGHLVDPSDFGGCYYPRFIAHDPGTGLSHHSWGIAIDVNVSQGLTGRQPSIDPRVVDAFESWGFKWGGEFLIPDGSHFEFIRWPS